MERGDFKLARVYKSKNVQSQPHLAGEHNMTERRLKLDKDKENDGLMDNVTEIFKKGTEQRRRGTNWTPEELEESLLEYFEYCGEKSLKPSKSGARLWLACSRSQYHAWETETAKYGGISDVIRMANDAMETQYINRGEQYPTMNVFLLKSSHKHIETSKMDVTTNGQALTSAEDVKDTISKLGLDK